MKAEDIYKAVKLSPLPKDKWVLLEDFKYMFNGITIIVPQGEETNGANIPRLFWSILPPNRSNYMPAVVLHDYLTRLEKYSLADDIFEDCLINLKIGDNVRKIMVKSVRLYHRIKYNVK